MFRLNLKDSSYYYVTKNFLQNTKKNWPKYVRKMYFIHFYLYKGDLVSHTGELEILPLSGRLPDTL